MAAAAGCGGEGEIADIEKAAEPTVIREAQDHGFSEAEAPTYLDAALRTPKLEDLRVRKKGETAATIQGRVKAEINLTPKPDKVDFLRVVAASGGTVSFARPFTAEAIKQGDRWAVVEDGVDFDDPAPHGLSPGEVEQARRLAVRAVTALLSFDGDVKAYDRAQGGFYATKRWSEADFNQPGFDPAPALTLKTKLGLSAWPRTHDAGEDDLSVGEVLEYSGAVPTGFDCSQGGMELRSMRPETVSGEPEPRGTAAPRLVEKKVMITGQAVVRAGNWRCEDERLFGPRQKNVKRVGPGETGLEYRAAVSRLGFGEREWFISGLTVRSRSEDFQPGIDANLYDTGSGQARVLADP